MIIEKIYRDHNPDKISNIPNLLEKYKGLEAEMLSKLAGKYDLQLERYIAVDYLQVVTEILKKHDPANASNASALLETYKGRETELLQALRVQCNDGFNAIIIAWYTTASHKQDFQPAAENPGTVFRMPEPSPSEIPAGKSSRKRLIALVGGGVVLVILVVLYLGGVFQSGSTSQSSATATELRQNTLPPGETGGDDAPVPDNSTGEKMAEGPIAVSSVAASSSMKSNGKITFSPENVADNNIQTWWSPSPPNSDGSNSWLTISFGQSRNVAAIEILNGSHYPDYPKYGDLYFKNNRLLKARLEFSNNTSQIIALREVDEIQKISFSVQNTTYVKIIPLAWANGSQWNDLCISQFTAIGE